MRMDTLTAACSLNAGAGRKGTGFLAAVATRRARQVTSTGGRAAASPVVGGIDPRAYGKKVSVQAGWSGAHALIAAAAIRVGGRPS